MQTYSMKAEKRDIFGKNLEQAKKQGKLPAVLYGAKQESTPLFVEQKEFKKIWKEAGESAVIKLSIPAGAVSVLINDVQHDPVSGLPSHVDFYAVDMSKNITANIPLEFVGEAPAIKLGGILVKVLHEVEVETLPKDLPQHLDIDLSALGTFEDKILVKDIKKPDEVKILAEPNDVVAFVEEAKEEVPEETAKTIEEIEVVKEKKAEENEEKAGEEKDK